MGVWIIRLEKIGRLVLWLALAALCVALPLAVDAQTKQQARIAEQAAAELKAEQKRALAEKQKDEEEKFARLSMKSMGAYLSVLDGATGRLWFTNVSPRKGYVCVQGTASSPKGETSSLASCKHVDTYASVQIELAFAGAAIRQLCQPDDCKLSIEEVDDVVPKK